jgi:peroxiredoxin
VLILIVVFETGQEFLFAKTGTQNMVVMESQVQLKKGDSAPDFELLGVDGKKHSLASYDADAVLVIFMCNHCPYVKAKVDAINEIQNKFNGKVAVIGINSNDSVAYPDDSFENMKKFAQEKSIKFSYLVDDTQQVAKRYGAVCTPDPFLFDRSRKLVFHGRIDNAMKPEDKATEKTMIANIEKLLLGQSIAKDFDPSIGCSIKWKN